MDRSMYFYLYTVVLFCLLCFAVVYARADMVKCEGKRVGVTIVKPTGKVLELCVGPQQLIISGDRTPW
jgi:hypothetical protein